MPENTTRRLRQNARIASARSSHRVMARNERQARALRTPALIRSDVNRHADRTTRGDLSLRPLARSDEIDAVIPEVFLEAFRLFHVLVLFNFGQNAGAGFKQPN